MGIFDLFRNAQPALVRRALDDVQRMLVLGQQMFDAATGTMLDNEILDLNLSATDDEINRLEERVRRVLLEHLTLDPERELVLSLKVISIVNEAERVGDLAKSIARNASLARQPRRGPLVERARQLRRSVEAAFGDTIAAFSERSPERAQMLIERHASVKAEATSLLRAIASSELSANEATTLALSVHMIARVSSHLSNIASAITSTFENLRRGAGVPAKRDAA
jgi:phosphate uptake regulator